jgi:hypothetical protein
VRDDDTPLLDSPLQNRRVICARETHVLNTDDIELRVSANEPSDDVSVEVLVRCRRSFSRTRVATCSTPIAESATREFLR